MENNLEKYGYVPISKSDHQNYINVLAKIAQLKNINAILLPALKVATHELNAIRARDGAPQHIEWHRGQPMQISSCTDEWWEELTETCLAAIAFAEPIDEDTP